MNSKPFSITLFCFVSLLLRDSFQENDVLPAVPLVVKNPYLSTWMSAKTLNDGWPTFWRGHVTGMTGMVRVNGVTYEFMGTPEQDPIGTRLKATQTGLKVTPTQSIFTFTADAVELTVNFFTPIDPTDLKRLSLPASYIAINARSLDKESHKIQVYFDMTGEWTSGSAKEVVEWDFNTIGANISNFNLHLKSPKPLQEIADSAQWGTVKVFTDSGVTHEAAPVTDMRSSFVKLGRLNNTIDKNFRAIDSNWPGVSFAREMIAGPKTSPNVYYGIAHVRRPAISYTVGEYNQLWESYFKGDANEMVSFFYNEREDALKRANELDIKVVGDARKAGGESYVKVLSASLRHAYGGIELVGTPENPWYMLKELSSDGNCQTVDVLYPHFSVQMYLNPKNVKYLLAPLLDNQEKGHFPRKYCMHDLGTHYPRCIGHTDGREETMEVEESANMLVMMAAYVNATGDKEFAVKHYNIAKQWTQYLVDHGLIPGAQLTTDDFLGKIINSTNLSIKAIAGIGGMAQLAEHTGNHVDQQHYRQIAESYVKEWMRLGEDPSGTHMKMSYNSPNTYFMIYNLFADILLNTKLVPEKIYKQQDEWYLKIVNKYGVPLINGKTVSLIEWSFLMASSSPNAKVRQAIYDKTALFLRDTPQRVPFTDSFDTVTGHMDRLGWIFRPVIGAVFAPLIAKNNHTF